ncbi:hypothetical protein CA13_13870 [Planctomycetes bacterium CA13]|uniref:Protein-glutamine gamma-glutamyltransferase-like C-terminal domain-containing protein n=2 Tax=Novipirellula herctigrandis TaxID=2527986 RepID=A0A5C5YY25_9BACT|nr:hypothetical protein CA13_13870 [Planctomycetes bacterium CA13]
MLRFLIGLILAAVIAAFLWINRDAILAWWESLWNRRSSDLAKQEDEFIDEDSSVPPRSFASFRNPIGSENDPRRVIVITFQALEAWAREQGTVRRRDETPSEFLKRIATAVPSMSTAAMQVVDAYNRVVYGGGKAHPSDVRAAESVWNQMK